MSDQEIKTLSNNFKLDQHACIFWELSEKKLKEEEQEEENDTSYTVLYYFMSGSLCVYERVFILLSCFCF